MSKEKHRKRLPVSVSAAVYIEDDMGRLLFLEQAAEYKGYRWGPPAGGMEANEDPFDVAIREVKEEIDVDVELIDVVGIYTVARGNNKSGIGFVFRGRIKKCPFIIKPKPPKHQRFTSRWEVLFYRFLYL